MFATAEDLNERRLRVLQLHVEELNRQAGTREAALTLAQARVKELERLRAASQPQERKLFAKVEQQQARRRPRNRGSQPTSALFPPTASIFSLLSYALMRHALMCPALVCSALVFVAAGGAQAVA